LRLWLDGRSIRFVFAAEFKANPIRPNQQAGAPLVGISTKNDPRKERRCSDDVTPSFRESFGKFRGMRGL
jgi:hypothetical protein